MKHIEGNFKGVRNIDVYHQAWLPEKKIKAVLLITHGLGEHSGRYGNVVSHFVPLGYAAYAFDHIGHGKSGGAREMVERFEDWTDMLTMYSDMVKGWQKGKPVFLIGHSLGGLVAAYYLIDHPTKFQGAVISAPLIKVGETVSPATVFLGKVMSALVPGAGLMMLDPTGISKDPAVVKAYVDDPLVHHNKIPARVAAEMLKGMQRIAAEGEKITSPFIVLQGAQDRLVDPTSARTLFDLAKSKDKTIKTYEGLHHEVFNEPERARVLKDVASWLAKRV